MALHDLHNLIFRKCVTSYCNLVKNLHIALEKSAKKCYNQKDFCISQCRSLFILYKIQWMGLDRWKEKDI